MHPHDAPPESLTRASYSTATTTKVRLYIIYESRCTITLLFAVCADGGSHTSPHIRTEIQSLNSGPLTRDNGT